MDMYTNYKFQHLDLTLHKKCGEKDVFEIVQKLRPNWKQSEVKIERIVVGFLNRTFSCLHKDDLELQKDGLFVRVNGINREANEKIFIHKEHEIRYLKEMNKHKIGAPLLATFNNGIVLKFMKGNTVSLEQLEDPEFERKVAKILAQIHVIPVPADMPKCWELKEGLHRCLENLEQDSNLGKAKNFHANYVEYLTKFGTSFSELKIMRTLPKSVVYL